jgi:uncharacterized protein (TIGR02145 family)
MRKIIIGVMIVISAVAVSAQSYNMKIKQVTGTTFTPTATVDQITFDNSTNFTCGNTILYGGKSYETILIGLQCWFKENLNIGTMINSTTGGTNSDGNQTNNDIIEKYCYNNDPNNCTLYGGFYQWAEAVQYQGGASNSSFLNTPFPGKVQGICPAGWHIPSQDEFSALQTSAGNSGYALTVVGHYYTVMGGHDTGTNTTGFSASLAGFFQFGSYFSDRDNAVIFQSITENGSSAGNVNVMWLSGNYIQFDNNTPKNYGYSVRCLKD